LEVLFAARDIREFDPAGNWDAIVFSEVLSYLAVHEATAEVRRYAKGRKLPYALCSTGFWLLVRPRANHSCMGGQSGPMKSGAGLWHHEASRGMSATARSVRHSS
jgi:hypothetical protein